MLIYVGCFIVIMILALDYEFNRRPAAITLTSVAVLLIVLAGFRNPAIEKDYNQYLFIFDMIYLDKNPLYLAIYEPGFMLIVFTVRTFVQENYALVIMLAYALLSIFLKTYAIRILAINPFLVLLFYFAHFFFLHEMTQIRIGLAAAVFFFALTYYFKEKKGTFAGLILLATLFHYTAILYIAVLFLNKYSLNRYLYTSLIVGAVLLVFIKVPLIGILSNLDSNDFTAKLENHTVASIYAADKINVLNVVTIINMLTCLYLIWAVLPAEFIKDNKLTIFLKCNTLSIFLLAFLSGVPTIAFRVSDLFGILSMFSFAYLARYLPFGKYNIFICIMLAAVFCYFFALNGTLVKPYQMVEIK